MKAQKEIAMGNVKVYKGRRSGELFYAGCRTALRVVRGIDVRGLRECGSNGCACHSSDSSFGEARADEAAFFIMTNGEPDLDLVA